MAKNENINYFMEAASSLASFLSNNRAFGNKLNELGINKIEKACSTPCYSTVGMLESLQNVKQPAEEFFRESERNRSDNIYSPQL